VDHARQANAGLYYANGPEFVEGLRLLMANDRLRAALGRNGRHYIRQHYRWDVVLGRFEKLVNKIKGRT
jgi:glycosyltransferase involved in cell wall biosynthesis